MKRNLILIFIAGLLTGIIYLYLRMDYDIKLYHPFPKLTTAIPAFKKIDQFLVLTANISWCKIKEKKTGKFFFFWLQDDGNFKILDATERLNYEIINRKELLERFQNPIESECF